VISDVDCLVDYPSSVNNEDAAAVQSFCHMTDLAKILGKVILHLYTSTNAATCSSAVFSHLDQSLSNWIQSLQTTITAESNTFPTPPSMDSAATTPRGASTPRQKDVTSGMSPDSSLQGSIEKIDNEAIGYYALLFHSVRIMLYRPFLHNSTLTPVLPLTLHSPQSRCRESAVAISEIAEMMVKDQRSYRQLFNTIHISLCAAATVHRFVIASSKTEEYPQGIELMDGKKWIGVSLYTVCDLLCNVFAIFFSFCLLRSLYSSSGKYCYDNDAGCHTTKPFRQFFGREE